MKVNSLQISFADIFLFDEFHDFFFLDLVNCEYYATSEDEFKDFFMLDDLKESNPTDDHLYVLRFFYLGKKTFKYRLVTQSDAVAREYFGDELPPMYNVNPTVPAFAPPSYEANQSGHVQSHRIRRDTFNRTVETTIPAPEYLSQNRTAPRIIDERMPSHVYEQYRSMQIPYNASHPVRITITRANSSDFETNSSNVTQTHSHNHLSPHWVNRTMNLSRANLSDYETNNSNHSNVRPTPLPDYLSQDWIDRVNNATTAAPRTMSHPERMPREYHNQTRPTLTRTNSTGFVSSPPSSLSSSSSDYSDESSIHYARNLTSNWVNRPVNRTIVSSARERRPQVGNSQTRVQVSSSSFYANQPNEVIVEVFKSKKFIKFVNLILNHAKSIHLNFFLF